MTERKQGSVPKHKNVGGSKTVASSMKKMPSSAFMARMMAAHTSKIKK